MEPGNHIVRQLHGVTRLNNNKGAVFSVVRAALLATQCALNTLQNNLHVFYVACAMPGARQRSRKHAFLITRDTCFLLGPTRGYIIKVCVQLGDC
jgi:hypothetical protein